MLLQLSRRLAKSALTSFPLSLQAAFEIFKPVIARKWYKLIFWKYSVIESIGTTFYSHETYDINKEKKKDIIDR